MNKVISRLIKHERDLNGKIKAKETYIDNLIESELKARGDLEQMVKEREETRLAIEKLGG